jgi:hypothetical protein
VVANNAAGNKVDFYAERTVDYDVRLGAEGTGIGVATVDLTNHAPSRGQPAYVIGPYSPAFRPGENVSLLDVYCAAGAGLNEFRLDGRRSTVGSQEELGHPVFQTRSLEVPSGGSRTLQYELLLSGVWEGGDLGGVYRLTFRGQSTIRPTSLSVEVQAPEGMHVVSASPGMEMDGGRAVWAGPAPDLLRLEVRFERPLLAGAWRAIIRFLRQPLFHIGQIGLLGGLILVRRRSKP